MSAKRTPVIEGLFACFRSDPGLLPAHVQARTEIDGVERALADYVAGMTDRFAMTEHRRLLEINDPA